MRCKLAQCSEAISFFYGCARFVAALALSVPERWTLICEEECRGRIAERPSGGGGFGYAPLFWPDGFGGSFADIPPETKNAVSHRAAALRSLLQMLDAEEW